MITAETIIVGGGPAGSSCARRLRQLGSECIVLDRQVFPRIKLCAGWITPQVVQDLEIDVDRYPHSWLSFADIQIHVRGFGFAMKTLQYSIRRYEFDNWLLQRSGAPVHTHLVKTIGQVDGYYTIDGKYRCRYLVGAGGTQCPVYRTFFRDVNPRAKELQTVTLEQEFPYRWQDGKCHLWFFDQGLPGYSWYVPKNPDHLNVGIGGMAHKLKQSDRDIRHYWERFTKMLDRHAFTTAYPYDPKGYSYYLRGNVDVVRIDNAFVTGDAAGLATRDLCEGIGPAVKSGMLAAEAIALGQRYSLHDLWRHSIDNGLVKRLLEYMIVRRKVHRQRSVAS